MRIIIKPKLGWSAIERQTNILKVMRLKLRKYVKRVAIYPFTWPSAHAYDHNTNWLRRHK